MKRIVLAAIAGMALGTSAMAAELPVYKAPPAKEYKSPCDVSFGTALTSDYVLRGYSQSDRQVAIQGYFEPSCQINDMIKIYGGVWGSSLATYIANVEIDVYAGVTFSLGIFDLDVGYVHYFYPGGVPNGVFNYGEFYVKPSVSVTDWLTLGASIYHAPNINQSGTVATYFAGNFEVTLPQFIPNIDTSISGELGRQVVQAAFGTSWTTWNLGVAFAYKIFTLDLRYHDTNVPAAACVAPTGRTTCNAAFVATLSADVALSDLK